VKSTPSSYDPSQIKKKRARLSSDLLPYKKTYVSSNLKASDPAKLESPIPMDANPMHSLQLLARSFCKASKKKKQVLISESKPATILSDNIENSGDHEESPSCK
jgi:hypothetical protein